MAFTSQHGTGQSGAHTVSSLPSLIQVPEVSEKLAYLESDAAIFYTLLQRIGAREKVRNQEYSWQEIPSHKTQTTVLAAVNSSAATITFADTSWMVPGSYFENLETGERFFAPKGVTITDSTGSVGATIIRGYQGTTAASMAAGDRIQLINRPYEVGEDKAQSTTRQRGTHTNYTEGTEELFEMTEEAMSTGVFGPGEASVQEKLKLREFRKKVNRKLTLGLKNKTTSATTGITDDLYTTAGLRSYCKMYNNIDVGPGVTTKTLRDSIARISAHSGVRGLDLTGLCSTKFHNMVAEFDKEFRRTTRMDKTVGTMVNTIEGPEGQINIVADRTLDLPGYDQEMLLFTSDQVTICEFTPFTVRRGVQTEGSHRWAVQFYSREGLKVEAPQNCGRLFNAQYAA